MNVKLLVDAVVQQTTVLIAQLCTAAGVRAPLSHIADQVFLSLAREIEAQGVGRKVAADMFGLALRSYQKKTRRAAESAAHPGKTLFEAVLEFVESSAGASRERILERFKYDNDRDVAGVLNDLVQNGLLYATGSGAATLYGVTSESDRQRLTRTSDEQALAAMLLAAIYREPGISRVELVKRHPVEGDGFERALASLMRDLQIEERAGSYYASTCQIPLSNVHGWEAAVFDHFQAVASAIANKVQLRARRSPAEHWIGGRTLRFELTPEHPLLPKVIGLLSQVRDMTDQLWAEVSDYNEGHRPDEEQRINATFYFGQNIDDVDALASRGPR